MVDTFELGRKEWLKVAQEVPLARQALNAAPSLSGEGPVPTPLSRLLTFFDWYQNYSQALEHKLKNLTWLAEQDQRVLGGMVDNLLEEMKLALMSPCSYLLDIFPKMVRDIARAQDKEVTLVMRGGEVEVDRRILEEMKDPLMHLVRNCLDHGLETPPERRQHNKPAQGTLTLIVSQVAGGKVEMVISDDGRGIDLEKVKAAAIKQGLLAVVEAKDLSQAEAAALIFQSALSTSATVTELSGRGLGMAIAQEKAEKLGGKIWVETSPHNGSTFRILLPLTLATFRGVLVAVADQVFIVPTMNVERVVRVEQANIKTVQGRETICLNERVLPLVSLAEVLEFPIVPAKDAKSPFSQVIILNATNKMVAFRVDAVLKEQEVLVKNLGKQLVRVRNVAAAAVLAYGQVAPILDVSDLIKSATNRAGVSRPTVSLVKPGEVKQPAILVVDDSITSRVLLKNILETAGYQTQTAIDGVDALTLLKQGDFDLVVSDVEMPRLNGFDLTTKIRGDAKLADLPLILVTSLTDPRERERGIEVGANAYIVKGSLDQSNLLSVIQRLI
jgi:two-component system chemotaxis sensor kinase CheA